jgi:hypothetical protein
MERACNRRLSSGAEAAASLLAKKMAGAKKARENVDLSDSSEDENATDGAGEPTAKQTDKGAHSDLKKLAKSMNGAWKRKGEDEAELKEAAKKKKKKEERDSGKGAARHPASAFIGDTVGEDDDNEGDEPDLGKN